MLSHQPPRLGPLSASSALAGSGACWDAGLEHFGEGASCLADWSLSGLPLPLLLRELWVPANRMTETGHKKGEQGREGGTERVLTSPFPLKKHFTFVDTASLESRRPRLAARRDPRLVVFEKSRDFATLYILIFLKLLLFFVLYCFILKAGTKLDMFSCACTHKTHTLPKTNFPVPCTHL